MQTSLAYISIDEIDSDNVMVLWKKFKGPTNQPY